MTTNQITRYIVDTKEPREIRLTESGEYIVELIAEGATARVVGSFDAVGQEKLDINLKVIHRASHTRAKTILKGVAHDQASLRFFGLIKIEAGCGDTQSFLEERVLLLSEKARAEAVPELEILADDVKCSHAASISQVPEEQIFYLQSRGIPRAEAENLIVSGFLEIS